MSLSNVLSDMADEQLLPANFHEDSEVLEEFGGEKRFQPDGEGYNLYFTKAEAERYEISPDCRTDGAFVVRNGKMEWIGRAQLGTGFSREELESYAAEQNWERVYQADGYRWSYTFEDLDSGTTISVDEPSIKDGQPLNNVFVRSQNVSLQPRLTNFDQLKGVAKAKNLDVGIRDSAGLWQRLKDANDLDVPDVEILSQITKKTEWTTAHLKFQFPSVWMSLDQLGVLVDAVNEAMEGIPKEDIIADVEDQEAAVS